MRPPLRPSMSSRHLGEEAADARAFDEAQRRLVSGEEELVPLEFADRLLLNGENPVRIWRELRGLEVEELSRRAGIGADELGDIEAGRREGGFRTMRSIADRLGVTLDDLA